MGVSRMTKRKYTEKKQIRQLQDAGFDVQDTRAIRLHTNPQDSTKAHAHAKMAVGKVLAEAGYKIDSEVSINGFQCDILAYGLEDRRPIVVELESEYDDEIVSQNIDRYYEGPIREVYTLSVDEFGTEIEAMHEHAKNELGL